MLRSRAALPLLLLCCACVGICGGTLQPLDREEVLRGARMPAITFTVEPPAKLDPWPRGENLQLFCSAFVEAQRGPASKGLHIELTVDTKEDLPVLFIGLRVICGFSFGLIPAYSQGTESLVARVENDGQFVREYRYEERIKVWAHLFLLPGYYTSDGLERVLQRIHADMVLHLIRDLRADLPSLVPVSSP